MSIQICEEIRQRLVSSVIRNRRLWQRTPWSYLIAGACVLGMTAIIVITKADSSMVNIPPLYLLAVQTTAVLAGSRAAVLASFLAFLAFDWFFVEPRYQFTVRDPFEFVALCVFLATAILVGQLTALLQARAQESQRREMAASALAKASWAVGSDLNRDSALSNVLSQLQYLSSVKIGILLLPSADNKFELAVEHPSGASSGMIISAEAV